MSGGATVNLRADHLFTLTEPTFWCVDIMVDAATAMTTNTRIRFVFAMNASHINRASNLISSF